MRIFYSVGLQFLPNPNKLRKDLLKLKEELQPLLPELIPIQPKDLEILSYHLEQFKAQKRMVFSAQGIFTSIYTEPMIAWGYKRYRSANNQALLYARTKEREFVYRVTKNGVELAMDNGFAGVLVADGRLLSARRKKVIGYLKPSADREMKPLFLQNREVASMIKPGTIQTPYPRVFEFVDEMTTEERDFVLSIAIWNLVQQALPNQD